MKGGMHLQSIKKSSQSCVSCIHVSWHVSGSNVLLGDYEGSICFRYKAFYLSAVQCDIYTTAQSELSYADTQWSYEV